MPRQPRETLGRKEERWVEEGRIGLMLSCFASTVPLVIRIGSLVLFGTCISPVAATVLGVSVTAAGLISVLALLPAAPAPLQTHKRKVLPPPAAVSIA